MLPLVEMPYWFLFISYGTYLSNPDSQIKRLLIKNENWILLSGQIWSFGLFRDYTQYQWEETKNTDSKFEFFRPSHYRVSFLSTVRVLAAVMINIFVTWRLHGNNSYQI